MDNPAKYSNGGKSSGPRMYTRGEMFRRVSAAGAISFGLGTFYGPEMLFNMLASGAKQPNPNQPPQRSIDFKLNNLNGMQVSLEESLNEGRIVLINYWATWCGPCKKEMPSLESFAERYKGKVDVLAITDDDPLNVRRYAEEKNLKNIRILLDDDRKVLKDYKITAYPTSILVCTHHEIKDRIEGEYNFMSPNTLAAYDKFLALHMKNAAQKSPQGSSF